MKKKISCFALTILMVLTIFPMSVCAENGNSTIFEYIVEFGNAQIVGIDESASGDIVIPENINGYTVTGIGNGFEFILESCDKITSITLPDSVKSIGANSFAGMDKLETVNIGKGVTEIHSPAFTGCPKLTAINVDENNRNYSSDEQGVLYSKDKTTIYRCPEGYKGSLYIIPNTVKKINYTVFADCDNLVNVIIPGSVTSIGASAFANCDKLKTVIIPEGVTEINNHVFSGCKMLENVSIPASVKSIGYAAFENCDKLTDVIIPEGVESISYSAFLGCTGLLSVTIPASVTEIGENAFGYYYLDEINRMEKNTDFVIYGEKGSAAEAYATKENFEFIDINNPDPDIIYYDKIEVRENSKVSVNDSMLTVVSSMSVSQFIRNVKNVNVKFLTADGNEMAKTEKLATGCKVNVVDKDGNVVAEYQVIYQEDVNGDGKVTAADARLALRTSAGLNSLEGVCFIAADCNADGKVTAADARKILRKAAGLE